MAYRTKQKEEAVKLANKIGLSKAAKQTNISIAALWAWKNSQEFAYLRNDSTSNPLDENEKRIRELETIKTLVGAGHIVITCGGGGIPVADRNGKLEGVNAVIDKDNASSLLAQQLDADYLIILTAVEKVAINFGKENQEWLSDLTVEQARQYIAEEQFAKGSMLPKVEASIRFAESKEGRHPLITLQDKAADGIAGKTGTVIHL